MKIISTVKQIIHIPKPQIPDFLPKPYTAHTVQQKINCLKFL